MELLELIDKGTPYLLIAFGVLIERLRQNVAQIGDDVEEIKKGITWGDTCKVKHDEIERRLRALEKRTGLNGTPE